MELEFVTVKGKKYYVKNWGLDLRNKGITELSYVDLNDNPIKEDELYLLEKSAQDVVKYCQEN